MATLTIKPGLTLTGTPDEIMDAARKLGVELSHGGYYFSESHGDWIRLAEMNPYHLRNALAKRFQAWIKNWPNDLDGLAKALVAGGPLNDRVFVDLLAEVQRRVTR